MGRRHPRWFRAQALQNAVSNAHAGNNPRDAMALAQFGTRATGGLYGKAKRMMDPGYREMYDDVLGEVQSQGHESICAFGAGADHRQVARMFDDVSVGKKAGDLKAARAHAMGGPFARSNRFTDEQRAKWAAEADRLSAENAVIQQREIPEFDWGQVIRDQEAEELANQEDIRAKLDRNPLGVSTGPGGL